MSERTVPMAQRAPHRVHQRWTRESATAVLLAACRAKGRLLYTEELGEHGLPHRPTVKALFGSFTQWATDHGFTPRLPVHRQKRAKRGRPPATTPRKKVEGKRSPSRLERLRAITAELYWPGPNYRLQRQRMVECCAAFDAQMAREAAKRKGGRPKSFTPGPAYRRRKAA